MSTQVFSKKQIIKYAETRLFGSNVCADDVRDIELYNAVLPSHLEEILRARVAPLTQANLRVQKAVRVLQENGREPIFFSRKDVGGKGSLHIPQYSGFGRRKRYEEMIKAYIQASGRRISFTSYELDGSRDKTNIYFDNYAYDFVKRLFGMGIMQDVSTIIAGPLEAVAKQAKVVQEIPDEYLDAQVVEVAGKKVLNIGYVYADQSGIIVDKMMRKYEAMVAENEGHRDIKYFMFGRVGGLGGLNRGDVVIPDGILDETDLLAGRAYVYPFYNIIQPKRICMRGNLFNVNSIIDEDSETLKSAYDWGCRCVEKEARETVESVNRAIRRYYGTLSIEFGFVGYVSDLPLYVHDNGERDTLAEELESDEGEQKAVGLILEEIGKG